MQEVAEDVVGDSERDHECGDQHHDVHHLTRGCPAGRGHQRRHPQEPDSHRRLGQEVEAGDRQGKRDRRQQGELLRLRASHVSQRGQ